jgi:hypothetical protein
MQTDPKLIKAILKECDKDIRDLMLSNTKTNHTWSSEKRKFKVWEELSQPAQIILLWQTLRDNRKHEISTSDVTT